MEYAVFVLLRLAYFIQHLSPSAVTAHLPRQPLSNLLTHFLSLWTCLFWTFHVNGIAHRVALCPASRRMPCVRGPPACSERRLRASWGSGAPVRGPPLTHAHPGWPWTQRLASPGRYREQSCRVAWGLWFHLLRGGRSLPRRLHCGTVPQAGTRLRFLRVLTSACYCARSFSVPAASCCAFRRRSAGLSIFSRACGPFASPREKRLLEPPLAFRLRLFLPLECKPSRHGAPARCVIHDVFSFTSRVLFPCRCPSAEPFCILMESSSPSFSLVARALVVISERPQPDPRS